MEIINTPQTVKGPSEWFTGEVWIDPMVEPDERSALSVISLTPERGAV